MHPWLSLLSLGLAMSGCGSAVRAIRAPPPLPTPVVSGPSSAALAAWLQGRVLLDAGDAYEAELALALAVRLDPGSPTVRRAWAEAALALGMAEVAVARLAEAPQDAAVAGARAGLVRARGAPGEAVEAYEEALSLGPAGEVERWSLRRGLVDALVDEGRVAEAVARVGAWAAEPLMDQRALGERGAARLRAGDAAGALADLGAAVALGARDPGVLGGLGRAARVAGRLGTGLQWLERAAVATPDDVGVAAERLALASDAGDPVSRLAAAQTLDAVMGDWEPWARLALAAALLDTGDPGAAMGVLDRLPASVVPEGAAEGALVGGAGDAARRTRAVALGALGRAHEGLAALGEPQDPAGVAVRARLLAAAGRADGAWALAEGLADEGSVGLDAVEAVARVTGDAARGVALLAPRAPLRAASLGLELGAVAAAEAALDGALDPSARAARATLLTGDGRAEQAVALLGPVVASGAATDGERRAFGLARDAAGDRFGAIAVMESLLEDGDPRAASWLAGALLAADVGDGELRRAERLARAAWDRAPGDASGLDLLARILLRAGRTAEAASLAERATRAAPGDPRFRATLETARQLAADGRSAP